jgi:hypothetical protein
MPKTAPPAPTYDQLHARACITCGRTTGPLLPAGYREVENRPGQLLPWPVVACPEHQSAAS